MSQNPNQNIEYFPGVEKPEEINICLSIYIPEKAALCGMQYPEGMPKVWSGNLQDFILMPIAGGKGKDAQASFKDEFLANCTVINPLLNSSGPSSWCNKRIIILGSEYLDLDRQNSFFVSLSVDDSGNIEVGKQMKDQAISARSYALVHK